MPIDDKINPEPLAFGGVYRCEFRGLGKNRNRNDYLRDPKVAIKGPDGDDYYGYVVYHYHDDKSNEIRRKLVLDKHLAGPVNVEVISTPKRYDPYGPYTLLATLDSLNVPESAKREISFKDATSVIVNERNYYGRIKPDERHGNKFIVTYDRKGNRLFGPLRPERLPLKDDRWGLNRAGYDRRKYGLLNTTDRICRKVDHGDHLLVHDIRHGLGKPIFVPIVTFHLNYRPHDLEGRLLETQVTSGGRPVTDRYSEGDIIENIVTPYTAMTYDWGEVLVGAVKREKDDRSVDRYFKYIFIRGALDMKGKYISKAKIITDRFNAIIAEPLEQ